MIEDLRVYTWTETQMKVPNHFKEYIGAQATPQAVIRSELQMLIDGEWVAVPNVHAQEGVG